MADEPENLVLVQLRDIRSILEQHTRQFVELNGRFDQVLDEVRGLKRMSKAAIGDAAAAELVAHDAEMAAERANRRIDELVARIEALEQR
jgi:outer membrane murein-binding lipoprotein Lpp